MTTRVTASTVEHVFHRALVMALVSVRFSVEFGAKGRGLIESTDLRAVDQMRHIINSSSDLRNALTSSETKLIDLEIGEWPDEIMTQMSWHSEACGCLLWCLNEIKELPPFDEPFDFPRLDSYFHGLPTLDWALRLCKKHVEFRDEKAILYKKRQTELIFKRCVFSGAVKRGKTRLPLKRYDEIFQFSSSGLPVGPSGDLIFLGREFCDLTEEEEKLIFPLVFSRAHAFYWLEKSSVSWDDVTLDDLYVLPK